MAAARPVLGMLAAVLVLTPAATAGGEQARARPELSLDVPATGLQGETLTVRGTFTNAGDADGARVFLDVVTDEAGPDGDLATDDAVGLAGVAFVDTLTRGTDIDFDALGRAVHPFVRRNGEPEVLAGTAGGRLWVAVDGYRETLLAGESVAFELALRVGKLAPVGRVQIVRLRAGLGRAAAGRSSSGAALTEFRDLALEPRALALDEVVGQLATQAVVSVPAAEQALTGPQLGSLATFAAGRTEPVRVAIVPAALGAPGRVLDALAGGIALDGTLLLLSGERWLATSTRLAPVDAQALLDSIVAEGGETDRIARDFMLALDRFAAAPPLAESLPAEPAAPTTPGPPSPPSAEAAPAAPPGAPAPPVAGPGSRDGSSGRAAFVVGLVVAGLALGLVGLGPGRRRLRAWSAGRREGATLRAEAHRLVGELGSEVGALVLELERPDVLEEARERYARAVELHADAQKRLLVAGTNEQLADVARVAERGRRELREATQVARRSTS